MAYIWLLLVAITEAQNIQLVLNLDVSLTDVSDQNVLPPDILDKDVLPPGILDLGVSPPVILDRDTWRY